MRDYIKVNPVAATVHITNNIDENGIVDYPLCGAPGNTPARAARFKPVVVDEAPTCKRCLFVGGYTEETARNEFEAIRLMKRGWTQEAAFNHVDGQCDIALCTHPDHEMQETARAIFAAAAMKPVPPEWITPAIAPDGARALRNFRDFGALAKWVDKDIAAALETAGYLILASGEYHITAAGLEQIA